MRAWFLLVAGGIVALGADDPVRPRATWSEKDASILAFSRDSSMVIASGKSGVQVRDAKTGAVRFALADRPYEVSSPSFSPDGTRLLAMVWSDRHKPVRVMDLKIWEVATGKLIETLPYVGDGENSVASHYALSPDGKTLAVGDLAERLPVKLSAAESIIGGQAHKIYFNGNPGLPRIRLWDMVRGEEIASLDGGHCMIFSPDGKTLATGSRDWMVPVARLWDVSTGKLIADLEGKAPWAKPMTFSPDGKFLAIGGEKDHTIWELSTRKSWPTPVDLNGSNPMEFSPDGSVLFPNGLPKGYPGSNMNQEFPAYRVSRMPPERVELGEAQRLVQPITYDEPRLLVSPSTMRTITFGEADKHQRRTVEVYTLPERKLVGEYFVDGLIQGDLSPDGRWLVLWTGHHVVDADGGNPAYERQFQILEPETGLEVMSLVLPRETVGDPGWRYSPDGETLAVRYTTRAEKEPGGEGSSTVDLWNLPKR